MNNPIEIFFSNAHEDELLMNDVRRQLIVEERNGRILKWYDREIPPGADWRQQIDNRLEHAKIILLFMSPHFIESLYCYEIEGQIALRRHETGEARVIPVILRPCLWERSPFGKLQALPRDANPVSKWPDRDEACMDVAEGVMVVVDELLANQDFAQDNKDFSRIAFFPPSQLSTISSGPGNEKVERLMPVLLQEMRDDLRNNPTTREFVLLKHGWVYNIQGPYLVYYIDDHEDLEGKLRVLENLGFVREITYNNVRRFLFEERFVDYLTGAA